MRSVNALPLLAICALSSVACSSDGGPSHPIAGEDFETELVANGSGGPSFAPGGPAALYPAGPYGTAAGSVAPNIELFGWKNPAASLYDPAALERISLADFYDPDGSKGSKVLLLSMAGVWCPPCQAEYSGGRYANGTTVEPFRVHLAERYDRGFRLFGTVAQDAQGGPAAIKDLSGWANTYNVEFPLAVDPAEKVGTLRDSDGVWPSAFIISTRDMRIHYKVSGIDPWSAVDKVLDEP